MAKASSCMLSLFSHTETLQDNFMNMFFPLTMVFLMSYSNMQKNKTIEVYKSRMTNIIHSPILTIFSLYLLTIQSFRYVFLSFRYTATPEAKVILLENHG